MKFYVRYVDTYRIGEQRERSNEPAHTRRLAWVFSSSMNKLCEYMKAQTTY